MAELPHTAHRHHPKSIFMTSDDGIESSIDDHFHLKSQPLSNIRSVSISSFTFYLS